MLTRLCNVLLEYFMHHVVPGMCKLYFRPCTTAVSHSGEPYKTQAYRCTVNKGLSSDLQPLTDEIKPPSTSLFFFTSPQSCLMWLEKPKADDLCDISPPWKINEMNCGYERFNAVSTLCLVTPDIFCQHHDTVAKPNLASSWRKQSCILTAIWSHTLGKSF